MTQNGKTDKPDTPVVTVQCVGCKKKKEVRPGDVPEGEMPMCDDCFNPMLAVSAHT